MILFLNFFNIRYSKFSRQDMILIIMIYHYVYSFCLFFNKNLFIIRGH